MKQSIFKKLILYFLAVLFMFALIIGGVFIVLFSSNTARIYQTELEKRALAISQTLSEFMVGNTDLGRADGGLMHGNGFGGYLRFIDDIAMSEIWIVDQNAKTVEVAVGRYHIDYSELPNKVTEMTKTVFSGKHAFHKEYNSKTSTSDIMVAVPLYDSNSQIVAAIILRNSAGDANALAKSGIQILFVCVAAASVFVIFLAYFLARNFISPLTKIEKTTKKIADGNYKVQTDIVQQDEIGSLAKHIDVLAQALDHASTESSKLEQMRKDFISNISHELRTPITVIKSSLEALCDGIVTEKKQVDEYHYQMMSESEHLERMVHDLLELSRLQNPDYTIQKEHLNLIFVLDDAVRSIKRLTHRNGIEVRYEKAVSEFSFWGDYVRLRQMFMIVLDNAMKFSQDHIHPFISIRFYKNNLKSTIEIENNGSTISKEELPYIFDKFYMGDNKQNSKGSGLGLSITKQIAMRHNIEIRVKSDIVTAFIFEFSESKNENESK